MRYEVLTKVLEEREEVDFNHNNYYIYIQTHSEGGFDGSIYNSKAEYDNEEECLDGGVCEVDEAYVEIDVFIQIADDVKKDEKCVLQLKSGNYITMES